MRQIRSITFDQVSIMILLNFSHPLTAEHRAQIERLCGQPVERIEELFTHFDLDQPFGPQIEALLASVALTPTEWQSQPILINPPSYNYITAVLLAELHGRMGYFAPLVRLKPVPDSIPPRYEVAEIINLQAQRDRARRTRS